MISKINELVINPHIYYTIEEASELLRVSKQAVLNLLRKGQANGIKIGKHWRILGLALLNLSTEKNVDEKLMINEWWKASNDSLKEVWDNEEDSIYDNL
jgi:excisionase family DNA binding protein